jgi:hypothetical protein
MRPKLALALGVLALAALLVAGPARATTTELIDVGADGNPPQGSIFPVVSADGNIVAFVTGQYGIVPGGGNRYGGDGTEVLVHDRAGERRAVRSAGERREQWWTAYQSRPDL